MPSKPILPIIASLSRISFVSANRQIWLIILVGLALGLANYFLGVYESLGRSMVLQVIISFLIGYPLIVLGHNAGKFWPEGTPVFRQYAMIIPVFFLLGVIATEGQLLADYLLFGNEDYRPFEAGGIYLFNGILSVVLGLMPVSWRPTPPSAEVGDPQATEIPQPEALTRIPIRKGETTVFISLEDIIYFEAYDNYSFLYDADGQRSLCSYSLLHLESRLDDRFLRVHRKYLINTSRIKGITPHLKGRYVISFADTQNSSVRSSAGFTEEVKALLKL